jgi:hypothetical protein
MKCFECPDNALTSRHCYDCKEKAEMDIKHNWAILIVMIIGFMIVSSLIFYYLLNV